MEYIKLIKDQEVSIAALFFIEGELINVIVKEVNKFRAGDSIICLLDSYPFSTKIIKIQEQNLYLYVPWADLQKLSERRRAVRISFYSEAQIQSRSEMIAVNTFDVSIKGLGFTSNIPLLLNERYNITFLIDGIKNKLDVIVKNQQQTEDGIRYGSLFVDATEMDLFYIRRYILKEQLGKLSGTA